MIKRTIVSMAGLTAAAGLLVVGAGVTQASAASANISNWSTSSRCGGILSPYYFCLYYHQWDGGGFWGSTSPQVGTITGTFTDGDGPVRNNAASVENATYCNVGIWVSPGYSGDTDWLSPRKGGNLGPALRNNEASIAVDDHSAGCVNLGIG